MFLLASKFLGNGRRTKVEVLPVEELKGPPTGTRSAAFRGRCSSWQFVCFGKLLWCEKWGLFLVKTLNSFYKPHFFHITTSKKILWNDRLLPSTANYFSCLIPPCCLLLKEWCCRSQPAEPLSFGSRAKSTWQHWILLYEPAFRALVLPESGEGIK